MLNCIKDINSLVTALPYTTQRNFSNIVCSLSNYCCMHHGLHMVWAALHEMQGVVPLGSVCSAEDAFGSVDCVQHFADSRRPLTPRHCSFARPGWKTCENAAQRGSEPKTACRR